MEKPTILGKYTASPAQTVAGKDSSNPLMGVHSPMNVEIPTVSSNDTTSPAQMMAGKDSSNPLTADTLPKNVGRILSASFKTTEQLPKEIAMNPEPPEPRSRIPREETRPPRTGTGLGLTNGDSDKYDRDYNLSMDQFAQYPNGNNDSGMDFDSEALNNLDT
ncbi:hypothetical protein FXO38_08964 [Capsicum annuum]|nr:hypothetical protein FXO38_08964 [Capsicum annuum]